MAALNRDKLFMVSRETAAARAHLALDRIQSLPPHEQVAAIAVLFEVVTRHNGIPASEAAHLGERLIRPDPFHRKANVQIEALQDFAGYSHPTD